MDNLLKKVIKNEILVLSCYFLLLVIFYFLAIYTVPTNASTFFGKWYWAFMGAFSLIVIGHSVFSVARAKKHKPCFAVNIADKMIRYGFLLKQLVARDFKTKYKRSFLGILWSFLNPLLMMGTQYIVFSTLLGNQNIPNYPIYLLVGVVTFNFFSESTTTGLGSITTNSSLIQKVYVPKYVYTLSKVLSSSINFAISFIPLIIFMLAMQVWPTQYIILTFFDLTLFFIFCLGIAMFLASVTVFFRDMAFIWGVVRLAWMYATPIFYNADKIQKEAFKMVIKFNPLYHFLKTARTLIGVQPGISAATSPSLTSWAVCIGSAAASIIIGCWVFKKQQEKFALYV